MYHNPTGCLKAHHPSPPDSPFPFSTCRDVANILSSAAPALDPHVHFPPSPTIACTYITHSPATYDRAPIAVSQNTCELPERGRRVYHPARRPHPLSDDPHQQALANAGDLHPRAMTTSTGMARIVDRDLRPPPLTSSNPNHDTTRLASASASALLDPDYGCPASSGSNGRRRCVSWTDGADSEAARGAGASDRHRDTRSMSSTFRPASLDDGCLGGF